MKNNKTLLIYNGPARGRVIPCVDAKGLEELAEVLARAAFTYAGEIEPGADVPKLLAEYDLARAWNLEQMRLA